VPDAGGECGARETPTMVAARLNDVVTLRALLDAGADLAAVDDNGWDAAAKADMRAGCEEAAVTIREEYVRRRGRGRGDDDTPLDRGGGDTVAAGAEEAVGAAAAAGAAAAGGAKSKATHRGGVGDGNNEEEYDPDALD